MFQGLKHPKELSSGLFSGVAHAAAIGALCVIAFGGFGCAGRQHSPANPDNICLIFREKSNWYDKARASYRRWGTPIPVLLAILHQESGLEAKAKPPRRTCLCIFPGPRPSSAYGYAQALDETWERYQRSTGNRGADRDDFGDAVDFVGWYCYLSHTECGISRGDAYNLYLAYHEGREGFKRGTYRRKQWLLRVAGKVRLRASRYAGQLASCEWEFRKRGGCCLWPF
jgi:hypothetical protein